MDLRQLENLYFLLSRVVNRGRRCFQFFSTTFSHWLDTAWRVSAAQSRVVFLTMGYGQVSLEALLFLNLALQPSIYKMRAPFW